MKCECGCGRRTAGKRFRRGHYKRGVGGHTKLKPVLCGCGCGCSAARGKKFISGHNSRGESHPMYGKKHSQKSKDLMAVSTSGEKNPNWNKRPSTKTIEKIRQSQLGKIISDETRENLSYSHIGLQCKEGHWNWKGGVTSDPYCPIFYNKEFRDYIFERDSWACQNPSRWGKSRKLVIHHIDGDKMNCDPINVVVVCNSCNVRAEGKKRSGWTRKEWQDHYERIIKGKYDQLE